MINFLIQILLICINWINLQRNLWLIQSIEHGTIEPKKKKTRKTLNLHGKLNQIERRNLW